jgi:tight adherence protein B
MILTPEFLLYGVIFVAAFLLIEGLYSMFADTRGGGKRSINRRLRLLDSGRDAFDVLNTLRRTSRGKPSEWLTKALPPIARFDRLVSQAELTIPTGRFLQIMAGLTIGTFVFHAALKHAITWESFVWAAVIGVALPFFYLSRRRRRRLARFGEQLPEALDTIVRSLRAGHPINAGLALVAKETPDPIGSEFGIVVDEMTYGLDLREALEHMADRVGHPDLQFVIVSIHIQHGTGGNLAEVLSGLSRVIRGRFHLKRKVRALSAEGRMSAYILSILPFIVGGLIWLINPGYYMRYMGDPTFNAIIIGGLVVMGLGIFTMYKMVNFRV